MGCDYNPAFFPKQKNKSFTLIKANEKYQNDFSLLCYVNYSNVYHIIGILKELICDPIWNVKVFHEVNS